MGSNILLALGSLLMFATFLGPANRLLIGNTQIASQNEYYIAALSYAQSVIDEAKTKKFDSTVPLTVKGSEDNLATTELLGGELSVEMMSGADTRATNGYLSTSNFDDVDDYNGYRRLVNSGRAEGYEISTTVQYVKFDDPEKVESGSTRCKKLTVRVTSPYFQKTEKDGVMSQDTLAMSYIFTL